MILNLLCVVPNLGDATSFYRVIGPLSALKRKHPELNLHLVFEQNPEWTHMKFADIVFLQRPVDNKAMRIADLARKCNTKIWVDYDDNLLEVPVQNPNYDFHQLNEVQIATRYMIGIADQVTVSTQLLAQRFSIYSKKITVIQNAWDDIQYPIQNMEYKKPEKIILWRGSNTHQYDLKEAIPAIFEASEKFPDYQWVFIGYRHPELSGLKEKAKFIPMMHMMAYFELLQEMRADVAIVPLQDNVFNRCKSNIAFLEGHYAGASVIAPTWNEWADVDCLYYDSFAEALLNTLDIHSISPDVSEQCWNNAHSTILDSFILSKTNEKRIQLIRELAG